MTTPIDFIVPLSIVTVSIQCAQAEVLMEKQNDIGLVLQHLAQLIHSKQDHDARAMQFIKSFVIPLTIN